MKECNANHNISCAIFLFFFYFGIICSLSASPSSSILGLDGVGPAPGACFFFMPLTISSILRSMQAASMAVFNVCAFTLYESHIFYSFMSAIAPVFPSMPTHAFFPICMLSLKSCHGPDHIDSTVLGQGSADGLKSHSL